MTDRKARYQRKQDARARRQQESNKARRGNMRRTALMSLGGIAIVGLAIGGLVLFMTTRSTFGKELPPTSFSAGHAETFPPRQINSQPIPRPVQEHIMERNATHQNGSMLVQYNCVDYQCEPDLKEKLTEIVGVYPANVYLAPYPTMDAMIALAAPGELLTLDVLDQNLIHQFIKDNLNK